jgi:hypothetical protein
MTRHHRDHNCHRRATTRMVACSFGNHHCHHCHHYFLMSCLSECREAFRHTRERDRLEAKLLVTGGDTVTVNRASACNPRAPENKPLPQLLTAAVAATARPSGLATRSQPAEQFSFRPSDDGNRHTKRQWRRS